MKKIGVLIVIIISMLLSSCVEEVEYTISFDTNSSISEIDILITDGQSVLILPNEPTKEGHVFLGWFLDSEFSIEFTEDTFVHSPITQDITLYAKWEKESHNIQFLDCDGAVLYSQRSEYGQDLNGIEVPIVPDKTGYTFNGWDQEIPEKMWNEDLIFNAVCSVNQYTIEFIDYDGIVLQSEVYDYGEDLSSIDSPTAPNRTGHTFVGWDQEIPDAMIDDNLIIRAVYSVNQYIIEFIDYDGTVLQSEVYDYGEDLSTIDSPTVPERTGHTFVGWDQEIPEIMGNEDLIFSAVYSVNQYTIEFIDYDGTVLQSEVYDYGTSLSGVVLPVEPTQYGFEFVGWDQEIPEIMETENIVIQAEYEFNYLSMFEEGAISLPSETISLFNSNVMERYFETTNRTYFYYQSDDEHILTVLDEEYTILHEIIVEGSVFSVLEIDMDRISVSVNKNPESETVIYDSLGNLILVMDTSIHFESYLTYYNSSSRNYVVLGNDTYIYVRRIETETFLENIFEIVKVSPTTEEIILSFTARYLSTFLLSNDSLLLQYEKYDESYEHLVQIDYSGNILYTEELSVKNIVPFSNGYLLSTFEEGISYGYYRRDNDSVNLWEYVSTNDFHNFVEDGDVIRAKAFSSNIDEVVFDEEGTIISITYEETIEKYSLMTYVLTDLLVVEEYRVYGDSSTIYKVDIVSLDGAVIMTSEYPSTTTVCTGDTRLYVKWVSNMGNHIDEYDFSGDLISSTTVELDVVFVKNNGNYIIHLENGGIQEITKTMLIVWTLDIVVEDFVVAEMNDGKVIVFEMINACPFCSFRTYHYKTYLVDEWGTVLYDYSESEQSYMVLLEDNFFGIYSTSNQTLSFHDQDMNLLQEYDVVYTEDNVFYLMIEGEFVTLVLEESPYFVMLYQLAILDK